MEFHRSEGSQFSRDIRRLDFSEVCSLRDWLDRYIRLEFEDRRSTDSKQLFPMLVRSNREYEGDLGVFVRDAE